MIKTHFFCAEHRQNICEAGLQKTPWCKRTHTKKGGLFLLPEIEAFYQGIGFAAYHILGAHRCNGGWQFTVWAPHALRVQVLGDWNAWHYDHALELAPCEDGLWRGILHMAAAKGCCYKYNVLGADGVWRLRLDPFGFWFEPLPGTASCLWQPSGAVPRLAGTGEALTQRPLAVYELHAGAWMRRPDGSANHWHYLADRLVPWLQQNGFTHVEFLPLAEHPFDGSWGYQGTGLFAPTSRFGPPEGFAALVRRLHKAGLGVWMDFVPLHFAGNPGALACFDGSPLFEPDASFEQFSPWGSLNFDFTRPEVCSFLLSAAARWLHQFGCDGLRVDAAELICARPGGWRFLQTLTAGLHARFPGVALCAEGGPSFVQATLSTEAGGLGFDFLWDSSPAAALCDCLAMNYDARSALFPRLASSLDHFYTAVRLNTVSHDDCAQAGLSARFFGSAQEQLLQARLLAFWQWLRPGKKLWFMGCEFAQQRGFDPCRELDWPLLQTPEHAHYARCFAALGALYAAHPALFSEEYDPRCFVWLAQGVSGVFAWLRRAGGEVLLCAMNLLPHPTGCVSLSLAALGCEQQYTELFHTAWPEISLPPGRSRNGELTLSLPPFGACVLALWPV